MPPPHSCRPVRHGVARGVQFGEPRTSGTRTNSSSLDAGLGRAPIGWDVLLTPGAHAGAELVEVGCHAYNPRETGSTRADGSARRASRTARGAAGAAAGCIATATTAWSRRRSRRRRAAGGRPGRRPRRPRSPPSAARARRRAPPACRTPMLHSAYLASISSPLRSTSASVSWNCTPWNADSGWPNCLRRLTCAMVSSMARSSIPSSVQHGSTSAKRHIAGPVRRRVSDSSSAVTNAGPVAP